MTSHTDIENHLRQLAPQVLGALVRRYGHFDTAEDAVQEALLAAATQWPREGRPDNPRAWLITVASRRLTDQLRSEEARRRREDAALLEPALVAPPSIEDRPPDRDDSLALLFLCCHPALTPASQIALTLRAVGGLTTEQIARAFLVPEKTMAQRISRAKQSIRSSRIPFELPPDEERAERIDAVLHVLYLIFNEGYTASSGTDLQRSELTAEAIRLTRDLRRLLPEDPEVEGLLALMLLTDARRAARTRSDGSLIPMAEQDRSLWDEATIEEGIALVTRALSRRQIGPYQLQAAIAAVHSEAKTADETDWPQIVGLYEVLERVAPNPMVTLNHAVAVAMAQGPQAGLDMLAGLQGDNRLARHHRLDAVRAHLLEMAGEHAAARAGYRTAARRTTSLPERRYLESRAAALADMTAVELAQRSGADVDTVQRLIELGIVSGVGSERAFSVTDIQRVRLARELDQSGIPLEAIGKAVSSGDLSFGFVDAIFPEPPALSAKTVRGVASELRVTLDAVERLYAMWGVAGPQADDPIREDDASIFTEWAAIVPPKALTQDVLVHGARLLGETARRIADFAFDSFRARVDAPMLASDTVLQQVMDATGAFSHAAITALQHQFAWLVQRQLEHHTTQFVVEYVEAAIESAGGLPRTASPPAMLFLDLTGYTALTEELGDEAAAERATLLAATVQEVAHASRGRLVKLLGDGAMLYFTDPGAAVLAGLELVERIDAAGLPPARIGIAAGPIVFREGDCFGRTVNIAARVMDRARPRQVAVTPEVVEATSAEAVQFEDAGDATLKGVAEPVHLAIASRRRDRIGSSQKDPQGSR